MSYVKPTIVTLAATEILEAMGPAHALGYVPPPPPCQTTCAMCADYCGRGC